MGVKDKIVEIPLDLLVNSDLNVRVEVSDEQVSVLADSIRRHGILQPIEVRPRGNKFEVIIGRTRVAAARRAGLKSIPACVVETDDREAVLRSLHENEARCDINPLERALAYKKLIDLGMTQQQIASEFDVAQPRVSDALTFLELPKEIQQKVLDEELDFETAVNIERITYTPAYKLKVAEALSGLTREEAREALKRVPPEGLAHFGPPPDIVGKHDYGIKPGLSFFFDNEEQKQFIYDVFKEGRSRIPSGNRLYDFVKKHTKAAGTGKRRAK